MWAELKNEWCWIKDKKYEKEVNYRDKDKYDFLFRWELDRIWDKIIKYKEKWIVVIIPVDLIKKNILELWDGVSFEKHRNINNILINQEETIEYIDKVIVPATENAKKWHLTKINSKEHREKLKDLTKNFYIEKWKPLNENDLEKEVDELLKKQKEIIWKLTVVNLFYQGKDSKWTYNLAFVNPLTKLWKYTHININLFKKDSLNDLNSTIIHELEHLIDYRFRVDSMKKLLSNWYIKEKCAPTDKDWNTYLSNPKEIVARITEMKKLLPSWKVESILELEKIYRTNSYLSKLIVDEIININPNDKNRIFKKLKIKYAKEISQNTNYLKNYINILEALKNTEPEYYNSKLNLIISKIKII